MWHEPRSKPSPSAQKRRREGYVYQQSHFDFAPVSDTHAALIAHNERTVIMPELGVGTKRCECTACGEFFNSPKGFDGHRVFADPKVEDWGTRLCLTPAQMMAKGWTKNAGGFWITEAYVREGEREC